MTSPSAAWQPLLAALANERLRAVYAAAVLGADVGATAKEVARLAAAGLLDPVDFSVAGGVFADALAAGSTPRPEGVDKHFDAGMLTHLPAAAAAREAVLAHLAQRLLPTSEVLSEKEVNRLLATVTTDIPTLRRALVDADLLRRSADGSRYEVHPRA
ncbi:DUF2087 domain-containing protein [Arthrobacter sp. 35W]|uniref:DUF2087 domain-containing protein n=1 Tax=Arthrobacter sp. 35W TaxID=1132441 RepID=UPI00040A29BA|nr:DUF2087 domain-containing protein [Arthrobacter sp. 35W]